MNKRILFAFAFLALISISSARSKDVVLEDEILNVWNKEAVRTLEEISSTGTTGNEVEPEPEAAVTSGEVTSGKVTSGINAATTLFSRATTGTKPVQATTSKYIKPTYVFKLQADIATFNLTKFLCKMSENLGSSECKPSDFTGVAYQDKAFARATGEVYVQFQLSATGSLANAEGVLDNIVAEIVAGNGATLDLGYPALSAGVSQNDIESEDNIASSEPEKSNSKTVAIAVGVTVAVVVVVAAVVIVVVLLTRKNKNKVSPDQLH